MKLVSTKFIAFIAAAILFNTGLYSNAVAQEKSPSKEEKITFDDHIKPIFARRCATCHSSDRTEGDLNVLNFVALMQGGGSGDVIEPFSADDSYLISLVNHDDSPEMPPGGNKLPDREIDLLRQWVNQGALENVASKAKKRKPKVDLMAVSANPNQRPETPPLPPRLSLEPEIHTPRKSQIRSIAASPWSPIVAIAVPKQVLLFDTQTYQLKGVIPFPAGNPEHLRFSRSGEVLLIAGGVGGASGKVVLWDVIKGEILTTIGEEMDAVLAADISPDHKWLALGGPKKIVRVYSVTDGNKRYELTDHTQWITAIEFSPDGKSLATADRNGGLIISDAASGNVNFKLTQHKQSVTAVSWRTDGKILASVSEDKSVRLWSATKGSQIKTWNAHGDGVTDVVFTNDGRILTAGRDKRVKLWKQNGKSEGEFKGLEDVAMALAWCGETKQLIAGDWRGNVLAWKPGKPEPVGKLNSNPPMIADRIASLSEKMIEAQQEFESAKQVLMAEVKKLEQLKQESAAKTNQLSQAQENEKNEQEEGDEKKEGQEKQDAQLVAEVAKIAKQIGAMTDAITPLKKDRNEKRALLKEARSVVKRWQEEAEFASSDTKSTAQ